MSSIQLFPEVRDKSGLGARRSQSFFLPVGLEGQADTAGTANVAQVYQVNRPTDSDGLFGAASSLGLLVKFLLGRGISPVFAAASVKSPTPPTLTQRQTAWATLESHPLVRLRMTDDTSQATLVALATSCDNANLIYNKQVAFGGMAAGTTKATLISAASAILNKRFILVGPGVYDLLGNLMSGNYAAAAVAAAVSQNPDITDDLDLMLLVNLAGLEMGANGLPVFTKRVASGVAVNDFEDLLQAGVSPVMADPDGTGVRITHLRTTFITDTTFDALETRLIVDQIFLDVKDYVTNNNFLRRGNTQQTRDDLQAGVQALLAERSAWITPVVQPSGTLGYNVQCAPTVDMRGVTVRYEGTVVRNVQTVDVDAELTIPV